MQKSKSSTNLNHKEAKQEETTEVFDSWRKSISVVIYPWDYFPGGSGGEGAVFSGPFFRGGIM